MKRILNLVRTFKSADSAIFPTFVEVDPSVKQNFVEVITNSIGPYKATGLFCQVAISWVSEEYHEVINADTDTEILLEFGDFVTALFLYRCHGSCISMPVIDVLCSAICSLKKKDIMDCLQLCMLNKPNRLGYPFFFEFLSDNNNSLHKLLMHHAN